MCREAMAEMSAVAIVTFGIGTPVGRGMAERLRRHGFSGEFVDLRSRLRDPRDSRSPVHWQTDGTHESTQVAVMSQEKFVDVVKECVRVV